MRLIVSSIIVVITAVVPTAVFAHPFISDALQEIYEERSDLQAAFDAQTHRSVPGSGAGFLIDLPDWAEQYGWREYGSLSDYAPESTHLPKRVLQSAAPSDVTATQFIVIDRQSRQVLAAKDAEREWPIASLTKLVTADVVLQSGVSPYDHHTILPSDDVGGAKLWVEEDASCTVQDLFYATLVGSANNAANALSRTTGMTRAQFVAEMNNRANALNLSHTAFVEPTGIELGNVSTAREIARVAEYVFNKRDVRRFTSTAARYISIYPDGESKYIKNTNWMLYKPEFDDIFIMSGKTGYLHESGWNLVISIRPDLYDRTRELLIVVFGADSRSDSFADARTLAGWAWETHSWQTQSSLPE